MPDRPVKFESRRSFLKFTGTLLAAVGGFSLSDILHAEALDLTKAPTGDGLSMDVKSAAEIQRVTATYITDPHWWLRIGLEGDEVSGYQVCMGIDSEPNEMEDIAILVQRIPVVVRRDCWSALSGTRIVFRERDGQKGFVFEGPLFDRATKDVLACR